MADIEGASIAPDVRPAEPAPAAAQMADVVEPVAPDVRASEPAAAAAQIADVAGPDARDSQPAPAVARASVLAGSQKRKRAADQTKSLEEVTAEIKACHEEADKAEADIRELQATAEAARAKARRLSQEYERKQRVAALARLEASCRKRPKNPYFIFSEEIRPTLWLGAGTGTGGMLKKIAELWANLSDEGKQPYKDKFELATQEYAAWAASEEGSRILRERNEVILQCKAASGELAEATAALQPRQQQEDEQATPAKSEQLPALSPNKDVKPDPKEKRADGSKAPKRDPRQLILTCTPETTIKYNPDAKTGTGSRDRYVKYAVATTIPEALEKGSTAADLVYDFERGIAEITGGPRRQPGTPVEGMGAFQKLLARWEKV